MREGLSMGMREWRRESIGEKKRDKGRKKGREQQRSTKGEEGEGPNHHPANLILNTCNGSSSLANGWLAS